MLHGEVWVGKNADEVAEEAARRFAAAAKSAIAARGEFVVALSGGSTPKLIYGHLSSGPLRDAVEWPKVEFFFGDERSVPADHPDSNFGLAKQLLFDRVPVDASRIQRIPGELPDGDSRYEDALRKVLGKELPRLDLILLGLGPDGHTASLFPHTSALAERKRWVVKNWVAKLNTNRFTMTAPLINNAREVIIAAAGAEKAPVLHLIEAAPEDPAQYPVLLVRPAGKLTWLLDQAARGE